YLLYHARFRTFVRALALEAAQFGIWVWLTYCVLALCGSAFLLWRRRRVTIIYNVLAETVQLALDQVSDRLEFTPLPVANRILFGLPAAAAPMRRETIQAARTTSTAPRINEGAEGHDPSGMESGLVSQLGELELDPFPATRHVTLRWRGVEETLRRDVEAGLAQGLADVESPDNPIAGWFMTVVGFFTLLILGCMVLIFVLEVLAR